jgi:protein ImuA
MPLRPVPANDIAISPFEGRKKGVWRTSAVLNLSPKFQTYALHPASYCSRKQGFEALTSAMAGQPLHEIGPAGPGSEAAALGFTLALAANWAGPAGVFWVGEEAAFAEEGAPYPAGLAQYGLSLDELIVVRATKRDDALWAAEQALAATGAIVICALGARGKPLDLKASRRLLLFAERAGSRCLLLMPENGPSAAWTRWRIAPAGSNAEPGELGPPAFLAELTRNRAGPAGAQFTLDWNAYERSFRERPLAGDLSAAAEDGSADPFRARAV